MSEGAKPLPPWGSAVAGATGAVLANALVYPLDMYVDTRISRCTDANSVRSVKTRLQVQIKRKDTDAIIHDPDHQHYESTLHAIQTIVEQEGIQGLYSGMGGALVGVASTNFAYFYWYSIVRTLYLRSGAQHSTAAELSLGAVAGALAQLFTIPIAVVTARQQTQRKSERKGILETGREVINSEDGWTGLWRGLKASLVLVVNPSITYGAYQRLREVLYPGRLNLRPHEAFRASSFLPFAIRTWLTVYSSRSSLQVSRYDLHTTSDRRQGRPPVQATPSPPGQAFQDLRRGDGLHRRA